LKPVSLGIIGCGIAARELHWPALRNLKDKFEIKMVCSRTEESAKSFSEMVGGVPYTIDYKEMLNSKEVEAVDIILPIHMNYQVILDSLKKKKHVIVEKPIASNLSDAKKMLSFEKRFKQVMMVAENYRYHPLYRRTKGIIDEGRIGELYGLFWNCFRYIDRTSKYAQMEWRINHQYEGGFVTDAGIHNIAAIRMIGGEISSGIAAIECINPTIGRMDSMSFLFATSQHVKGVFNIYYSVNGYSEEKLLLLGTEGSIVVENNTIIIKKKDEPDSIERIESDGGYTAEFEDFYKAIREGKATESPFSEAYMDLQVMLGAIESAQK